MHSHERRFNSLLLAGICCALVACSEDEASKVEAPQGQPVVAVTRALATVGGTPLGADEVLSYVASRPSGAGGPMTAEALAQLLDEMVTAEVLYQEALRRKLDRIPATRQSLRQMFAQKLLEEEVQRRVLAREIGDEELDAYLARHRFEYAWPEQVRLADIFISVDEDATDGERASRLQLAGQVLAQAIARQGDRFGFSELISKYSDKHPGYAIGDTGLFDREGAPIGLAKPLAEAGFTLARNGQLHPAVIETPEGFHVVMRVGHRAARQTDPRAVKRALVQRIRREELEQQRAAYIRELREQASVRIEPGNVAALLAQLKGSNTSRAEQVVDGAGRGAGSATPAFPDRGQ